MPRIDNTTSAARKRLGFLKFKLGDTTSSSRLKAYKTHVRPLIKYLSILWDPHIVVGIEKLEKIQRLAAPFIYKRFKQRVPQPVCWKPRTWNH